MSKEVKSILFTAFLFILFCLMALEANTFTDKAKFFPFFVAIGAAFIAFVSVILQTFEHVKKTKEEEEEAVEMKKMLKYIFWFVGYGVLIYVLGFMPATILFLLVFLLVESKFRVMTTILSTALVVGVLILFANVMNLYWPAGVLGITLFS
ncbi:Tripartite tricarboxylate transporter TctB family protein [Lentibacillus halodurans]|uniref:Tripartite tricarboxylate transporter TctB family protein n=1 Tax=Lentibacillus halodurans TaxID=237679 RepID=A0A1I0YA70_9BACI|nr:tripartite tricarboxylate transporter TctB family protein [Lentibacillus halodurans]SFB10295.1 Tripartite tricarboxylate transporter TctB family protein [Lentibacillus halodurans]